jgi:hypothetical protein
VPVGDKCNKRLPDRKELQESAAILAAEDELSDNEIAQHCGITRRTLMRWKKQSAIQQKIDEHLRLSKQDSERQMIVERQMRIADMAVMLQKLEDIIRERAKSPEMRGVPGGTTGLMRRRKVSFRKPHGPCVIMSWIRGCCGNRVGCWWRWPKPWGSGRGPNIDRSPARRTPK